MPPKHTEDAMPEAMRVALRQSPFYDKQWYRRREDIPEGMTDVFQRRDEDRWWSEHVLPVLSLQRRLVAEEAAHVVRTAGLDAGGDYTAKLRDWLARKVELVCRLPSLEGARGHHA